MPYQDTYPYRIRKSPTFAPICCQTCKRVIQMGEKYAGYSPGKEFCLECDNIKLCSKQEHTNLQTHKVLKKPLLLKTKQTKSFTPNIMVKKAMSLRNFKKTR